MVVKLTARAQFAGFTLVEVLVALGIFAIMSSGFLVATKKASQQLVSVEERTIGLWLVENQLALLTVTQDDLDSQSGQQEVEAASRDWYVTTQFEPTEVQGMQRANVSVALKNDEDRQITSLESYFFKPEQ